MGADLCLEPLELDEFPPLNKVLVKFSELSSLLWFLLLHYLNILPVLVIAKNFDMEEKGVRSQIRKVSFTGGISIYAKLKLFLSPVKPFLQLCFYFLSPPF